MQYATQYHLADNWSDRDKRGAWGDSCPPVEMPEPSVLLIYIIFTSFIHQKLFITLLLVLWICTVFCMHS